jgi:hypothetical protein
MHSELAPMLRRIACMWRVVAASVDLVHALLMVAWVVALPLLFVRRWPRLARASAIYAVVFIALSQGSQMLLGECFFTTLARRAWEHAALDGAAPASNEWFTVRVARAVFGMSPSHHAITRVFEVIVLVVAAGILASLARGRRSAATS